MNFSSSSSSARQHCTTKNYCLLTQSHRWTPVCEPVMLLTVFNPALFGPINNQIFPQAFSWAPGGNHLLKNGLKFNFPRKSSDNDPAKVSQSLSSRVIAVWKRGYINLSLFNIQQIRWKVCCLICSLYPTLTISDDTQKWSGYLRWWLLHNIESIIWNAKCGFWYTT